MRRIRSPTAYRQSSVAPLIRSPQYRSRIPSWHREDAEGVSSMERNAGPLTPSPPSSMWEDGERGRTTTEDAEAILSPSPACESDEEAGSGPRNRPAVNCSSPSQD